MERDKLYEFLIKQSLIWRYKLKKNWDKIHSLIMEYLSFFTGKPEEIYKLMGEYYEIAESISKKEPLPVFLNLIYVEDHDEKEKAFIEKIGYKNYKLLKKIDILYFSESKEQAKRLREKLKMHPKFEDIIEKLDEICPLS